jgi:RNA polymerase sigma factor (sigma-70 family)
MVPPPAPVAAKEPARAPVPAKVPRLSAALLRSQSDARLTRLAAAGYEGAFEAIVQRYRVPLQGYCRRYLRPAAAEDVVQQAFFELWARLAAGQQIREVRPWLYRVVHNGALNTIRRGDYRAEQLPEISATADSPEVAFERTAELREALAGMAALPEQQREAIVSNALDGRSRSQIALAMGTSDGAVGQLLHRARVTLRSAMSALVPWPLVAWAAARRAGGPTAARVLSTAGAGGAPAGLLLKGGATLAVIAAATAAPLVVKHTVAQDASPSTGAVSAASQRLESRALDAPKLVSAFPGYPVAPPGTVNRAASVRSTTSRAPASSAIAASSEPAAPESAEALPPATEPAAPSPKAEASAAPEAPPPAESPEAPTQEAPPAEAGAPPPEAAEAPPTEPTPPPVA